MKTRIGEIYLDGWNNRLCIVIQHDEAMCFNGMAIYFKSGYFYLSELMTDVFCEN